VKVTICQLTLKLYHKLLQAFYDWKREVAALFEIKQQNVSNMKNMKKHVKALSAKLQESMDSIT
jgi:Skp family chaperone for outer membrane proteins